MIRLSPILLIIALASCAAPGSAPDPAQMQRDIKIACDAWHVSRDAAQAAGLFIPGVSDAAILIGDFADPACNGALAIDPSMPSKIRADTAKLRALLKETA